MPSKDTIVTFKDLAAKGGPRKTAGSIIAEACNRVFGCFRRRRKARGRAPKQGPQCSTTMETATATILH